MIIYLTLRHYNIIELSVLFTTQSLRN